MSKASIASAKRSSSVYRAVVGGGLAAGVLDLAAAFVLAGVRRGTGPDRVLQGIASGLLGADAFQGGAATAVLGALLHFFIAFSAAAVYVTASRRLPVLVRHAVWSGAFYGVAVYFFMRYVVIELSAIQPGPFSVTALLTGLIVHILCVGLPVALIARRYLK